MKAPKYKRFDTQEEAEKWMQSFSHGDTSITVNDALYLDEDDEGEDDPDVPAGKKIKAEIEVSLGGVEDPDLEEIYTDGSTLSNGQEGAVAGVGVFFGDGDPRFVYCFRPLISTELWY